MLSFVCHNAVDDLRANTEYSGYSNASPVIQWFWEVVQGFSKEDKARFLQFVTGTSKVSPSVHQLITKTDNILECLFLPGRKYAINEDRWGWKTLHIIFIPLNLDDLVSLNTYAQTSANTVAFLLIRFLWKVLVHFKEYQVLRGSRFTRHMVVLNTCPQPTLGMHAFLPVFRRLVSLHSHLQDYFVAILLRILN